MLALFESVTLSRFKDTTSFCFAIIEEKGGYMSTSQIAVIAILVVGFFICRHLYLKLPSYKDED